MYHHANANKRRAKNNIVALKDGNGNWCTTREELENLLTDHYSLLHTTSSPAKNEDILNCIPSVISSSDNLELMRIPEDAEIFKALKDMKPWKAPGPDGFPPGFFNIIWILLILSMRLKKVMGKVISPLKAAYIQGRQITDNIFLAHEIVHTMKNKKEVNKYLALKLDISKAFDRLEWSFLKNVMLKMRFCSDWCNLIVQCVSTTQISILINGVPCKPYFPTRGVRQVIDDSGDASGQMVNFNKSSVYYSANVPQRFCRLLTRRLKVPRMNSNERYPGIPLVIGKNKVRCFTGLVERVQNQLSN
ncbi:uncharacterized protein LOC113336803 [Papaver somniferum]|uniref:uncharacterized protein LOC113336803 n=1 Tax=Papaver somniferum TaxID=3469 RepID=UPI000E6FF3F7|nr:uncharacterized protein LOC113336803 [Papaver somniferum]